MTNDGGPAFPVPNNVLGGSTGGYTGMSLRDYFAGQALQGMLAGHGYVEAAKWCYFHADAMLKAREGK